MYIYVYIYIHICIHDFNMKFIFFRQITFVYIKALKLTLNIRAPSARSSCRTPPNKLDILQINTITITMMITIIIILLLLLLTITITMLLITTIILNIVRTINLTIARRMHINKHNPDNRQNRHNTTYNDP